MLTQGGRAPPSAQPRPAPHPAQFLPVAWPQAPPLHPSDPNSRAGDVAARRPPPRSQAGAGPKPWSRRMGPAPSLGSSPKCATACDVSGLGAHPPAHSARLHQSALAALCEARPRSAQRALPRGGRDCDGAWPHSVAAPKALLFPLPRSRPSSRPVLQGPGLPRPPPPAARHGRLRSPLGLRAGRRAAPVQHPTRARRRYAVDGGQAAPRA